jgi:hypothetical protein
VVSLLLSAAAIAGAQQVGYPPSASPYLDLEQSQELTLIGGPYHGHRDAADVAPQGGTLLGAHYEWRAAGPLHLIGELIRVESQSRIIDPFKAGVARELGTKDRPLWAADFDLGMSLTGGKSWHHFVPEVQGGVGLISQFATEPDTGGFHFGTRFTLNLGAGIRYILTSKWQIRADIKDRLYTIDYPESFYLVPSGGTAVIPITQSKSFWTNNPALTLGLSRLF